MDYRQHYNNLIEKRKISIPEGYGEVHHIVPKCMGGSNKKSNLIKLTPREHFFAHLLLAKVYKGKLWAAVNRMMNSNVHNSREYAWARKNFSKSIQGPGNGRYGKLVTEETRQKISKKNKGKPCPKHVKEIASKTHLGRKQPYKERSNKARARGGRPFKVYRATVVGSNPRWQRVYKEELVGIWEIQRECSKDLGIPHQPINKCLRGIGKHVKGFVFEWI